MSDWIITEEEKNLMAKYKCTGSSNGGWYNGIKIGSRMKCPKAHLCKNGGRMCDIGFQRGLLEMDSEK